MTETVRPRFLLGQVLATPGVLQELKRSGQTPDEFFRRHIRGDWGDVSEDDVKLNDEALQDGSRVMSSYKTKLGTKLWVITEATDENGNRACTTLLLPSEY